MTSVIDGDTIEVMMNGQRWRVRYIGVNTPERGQPCFQEATDANLRLVAGQPVVLVKDVSDTDRFGRLLRYVYLGDMMVNAQLVKDGWAEAVAYRPDTTHAALFSRLEEEAVASRVGCHSLNMAVGALPSALSSRPSTTYYVQGSANLRSCPNRSCEVIVQLGAGTALQVYNITSGEIVSGSSTWYEVEYHPCLVTLVIVRKHAQQ